MLGGPAHAQGRGLRACGGDPGGHADEPSVPPAPSPPGPARERAAARLPSIDRWHAQRQAYQELPDDELLVARAVALNLDLDAVISRPGLRVVCEACGEEVINQREAETGGQVVCRACADGAYSRSLGDGCTGRAT